MAVIDVTTFLGIADRAATQYGMFVAPFTSINLQGTGFYWERVTATDNPEVESFLMAPYYTVDQDFDAFEIFKAGMTTIQLIITSMDGYLSAAGVNGSWDGYLRDNDSRVSDWLNQIYLASKNFYMLANNVFSEEQGIFGTWETGNVFTDGIDYGDGSWYNKAEGSYYAATQLKAIVDVGSTACTSLVLRLSVKDINNNPTTIDTSVITGGVGTEVDIGVSTDRFLDVTNIVVISGALAGNKVRIENKKERQVVL